MREAALGSASAAERDRGLLWHPYGPLHGPAPLEVTGAHGCRLQLRDATGREHDVLDAMASWWCQIHGYRHEVLDAAAHAQIDTFSHVMFGGLTHEPAVALAERLVDLAPEGLAHVFLADSGSVSVEVALKVALQHQAAQGRPGRSRLASLRGGYHGDTFATMSVGDPEGSLHATFPSLIPGQIHLPRPPRGTWDAAADDVTAPEAEVAAWEAQVRAAVAARTDEIAGIICEPVLQGAGGMHPWPLECLRILRAVCDEHELLLIADEIATGLGRLGHLTACGWAGVTPDVMCVGKALTGGYLSLAAVLVTERVGMVIEGSDLGALMHGPTFMGNPLACRIACAALDLLRGAEPGGGTRADALRIGQGLQAGLAPAWELPAVVDVRTLGAVGVIQLDTPVDVPALTRAAVAHGVWVRPFRDLVYTMPPLVIDDAELGALTAGLVAAVATTCEKENEAL